MKKAHSKRQTNHRGQDTTSQSYKNAHTLIKRTKLTHVHRHPSAYAQLHTSTLSHTFIQNMTTKWGKKISLCKTKIMFVSTKWLDAKNNLD